MKFDLHNICIKLSTPPLTITPFFKNSNDIKMKDVILTMSRKPDKINVSSLV